MKLTSQDFKDQQRVVELQFSGYGKGIFPQLSWTGVPKKAKSLALLVHDKDAPGPQGAFHALIVNISPETKSFNQNVTNLPSGEFLANDLGKVGYTPPKPPAGHGNHANTFYLYALPYDSIEHCFKAVGYPYTKKTTNNLIAAVINFTKIAEATLTFNIEKVA